MAANPCSSWTSTSSTSNRDVAATTRAIRSWGNSYYRNIAAAEERETLTWVSNNCPTRDTSSFDLQGLQLSLAQMVVVAVLARGTLLEPQQPRMEQR